MNKKTTTTNTNTPKRKKGHTTTHTVLNIVVNTMPAKRMRCFCHENFVLVVVTKEYYYYYYYSLSKSCSRYSSVVHTVLRIYYCSRGYYQPLTGVEVDFTVLVIKVATGLLFENCSYPDNSYLSLCTFGPDLAVLIKIQSSTQI